VVRIEPEGGLKVPHMGWNTLTAHCSRTRCSPASRMVRDGLHAYFVHSYHLSVAHPETRCLATADYGQPVTAIVGRDNMVGTQFHPEKSQTLGPEAHRQLPEVRTRCTPPPGLPHKGGGAVPCAWLDRACRSGGHPPLDGEGWGGVCPTLDARRSLA
jgi:hypothetical protein